MDDIRVLRILNRFAVGGPIVNVAELSKGLEQPFKSMVAGGHPGVGEKDARPWLQDQGLEPVTVPEMVRWPSLKYDLRSYRFLRKLIREFKPHIVHTHGAKSGFLGRLAAMHEKVPVTVHTYHGHTFHSYFSPFKTRIYKGLERWINRRSTAIIALSERQRADIVEKYKAAPGKIVHIIPLGFNISDFQADWSLHRRQFREYHNIPDDHFVIGWIGRMEQVKDPSLFVDLIRKLNQRLQIPFKAVMVGDGYYKLILQMLAERSPGEEALDNLIFTSWIHPPKKAMSGIDILVLTSLNEGTPLSVIEAQAAGIPVIASPVGGVPDLIEDGIDGMLFKDRDPEQMARQLESLASNKQLRDAISARSREKVLKQFDSLRLVKDISELYLKLLKKS